MQAAGEHGAVDGGPGLDDQLPQLGREHPDGLLGADAGRGGQVVVQAEAQPARHDQPGQHHLTGGEGTGRVQRGPDPAQRRVGPVGVGGHVPGRAPRHPGAGTRQVPGLRQPAAMSPAAAGARNRSQSRTGYRSGSLGDLAAYPADAGVLPGPARGYQQ